jgi:F-box/leucine-rich repeat protein 7
MRRHHGGRGGPPSRGGANLPLPDGYAFEADNPARPVRPSPLSRSQIKDLPLGLLDRVRSLPLFRSASDVFVEEVLNHLRPQIYSVNDNILTEGEEAKAMYWLVRGEVAVTSRDGESVYAELKQGAFFGEIGILMDRPRTATIVAKTKCHVVVLKKEDLRSILPAFPEVEKAIMDEAQERLTILEKKKKQQSIPDTDAPFPGRRSSKRSHDQIFSGQLEDTVNGVSKKRKSPSPGLPTTISPSSALESGVINVRPLLKELPLFSSAPDDVLHFLGLNALPRTFPPFTDIIKQDSQGREVFFICRGEVEVIDERVEDPQPAPPPGANLVNGVKRKKRNQPPIVKARLKQGQYFGEVVSLSLAPRRTATVRSVSLVECLMITGDVLEEYWERLPREIRQQIEKTAKERLASASDNDVVMPDAGETATPPIDELELDEKPPETPKKPPRVTFSETDMEGPHKPNRIEDRPVLKMSDPDPFLNAGLNNVRSRSRRGSLAPIPPDESPSDSPRRGPSPPDSRNSLPSSPLKPKYPTTPPDYFHGALKRPKQTHRSPPPKSSEGRLPEKVLINIFNNLNIHELMKLRCVSRKWSQILTKSPDLLHTLDLTPFNRKVTDDALTNAICPFVGSRPRVIDISNCFHITDEGFTSLAGICGSNVQSWKMKSVWDVTAPAILEMANKARGLQEVDLSNCRKVSDTLLARIVGWVVQQALNTNHPQTQANGRPMLNTRVASQGQQQHQIPAGTVFGCPQLKRLTLSYCKHVTDRSMHHIASHAAPRLEHVDLTRCTTITDQGFQYWGNAQFSRLRKLCLADCTYLTDNAIVYLTNAAKGLQELDLVSHYSLTFLPPH